MTTMPIMMLGSDFQYAFAPSGRSMGADSLNTAGGTPGNVFWLPKPYTGAIPSGYVARNPQDPNSYDANGSLACDLKADRPISTGASARTLWDDVKTNIPNLITATKDTIIAAIKAKHPGISDADAQIVANQGRSFSLAGSMPWLIIGGVGLVALMFMLGTRKR